MGHLRLFFLHKKNQSIYDWKTFDKMKMKTSSPFPAEIMKNIASTNTIKGLNDQENSLWEVRRKSLSPTTMSRKSKYRLTMASIDCPSRPTKKSKKGRTSSTRKTACLPLKLSSRSLPSWTAGRNRNPKLTNSLRTLCTKKRIRWSTQTMKSKKSRLKSKGLSWGTIRDRGHP